MNEWQREVDPIEGRIDDLTGADALSIDEGRSLVAAAAQFFAQLDALEASESNIDFVNAGESLKVAFARQQDIIFCNAREALNSLDVVVQSGENWDRDKQIALAREPEGGHLDKLEQRPDGFVGCSRPG